MARSSLDDVKALLERAELHIREAAAGLNDYNEQTPYEFVEDLDEVTGERVVTASFSQDVPTSIKIEIRDAADKLRSALDFTACALARKNSKSDSGVYFPIAGSKADFESKSTIKKIKKLSDEAQSFLLSQNAYQDGRGEMFWALNKLRNCEVHRELVAVGRKVNSIEMQNLTLPPGGRVFFPMWSNSIESLEVFRAGPSVKFEGNIEIKISLAFTGIAALEKQPILPHLNKFSHSVSDFVFTVDRLFF